MRKVLIVVDMQNDFVTGALGSSEAQAIVPNVVNKIKNWDGLVLFTRDTHYEDYLGTLEGKKLPISHCIKNTNGWNIIDELKNFSNKNNTIDKYTFGFKDWVWILDEVFSIFEDKFEFELCGLCTDICVVSNALALRMFFQNTKITVDASCCAGVTPEKHKAALEVMKSCQIEVINE